MDCCRDMSGWEHGWNHPAARNEGFRDLNADLDVRNIVSIQHDVVATLGGATVSKEAVDLVQEAAPQRGELLPRRGLCDDRCGAFRCRPDADVVAQRDSSRPAGKPVTAAGAPRFHLVPS